MPRNNTIPYELSDYVLSRRFTESAARQGWLNDERIIAAVSGGGDSLSLLMMAAKFFTGHITVLHIMETNAYVQRVSANLDKK